MTSANKATIAISRPGPILVFLAPAFIVYTLFMIYPLLDSLRLSLYAPDVSRQEVLSAWTLRAAGDRRYVTPRVEGAIKNNLCFRDPHAGQNPIG